MMTTEPIRGDESALLIVDLQNDFLHPDGAYARGGQQCSSISALPERILPVVQALRAAGGWIVSTQFTLVPGKGGVPFISPHLARLRPFLQQGDFQPGAWGHQLVEELQPADMTVEKIAYSAFHQTRLEFVLNRAGIKQLFVAGIVTNGGVASTVRAAHVRDIPVTVIADGCAAFSDAAHDAALADLATVAQQVSCAEAIRLIAQLPG